MAKTVKYYLGITTYNTQFTTIEITKKQYNEMLKKYEKIVEDNHKNLVSETDDPESSEYYVGRVTRTNEAEKYVDEFIDFEDGATYITLMTRTCKEGFRFN